MWCYSRTLGIKWTDKRTNDSVRQQVSDMAGSARRSILEIAKRRTFRWFLRVNRCQKELDLAHTILHGRVPVNRTRIRRKGAGLEKLYDGGGGMGLTDVARASHSRSGWRRICHQSVSADWEGL